MSAPVPVLAAEIRYALLVVGTFAESLGVSYSLALLAGGNRWHLPDGTPQPALCVLGNVEAIGWTVLAHWIEHGGNPIERIMRRGGTTTVGWRVSLAGQLWSRAQASEQDHARVAGLAAALLVLRRWTTPVPPWGLRDLPTEALDKIAREAGVRVLGPRPSSTLTSPIPADYLAAYGTASE